jgi:hypothetical protein
MLLTYTHFSPTMNKSMKKYILIASLAVLALPSLAMGSSLVGSLIAGKTPSEAIQVLADQLSETLNRVGVLEQKQAELEQRLDESLQAAKANEETLTPSPAATSYPNLEDPIVAGNYEISAESKMIQCYNLKKPIVSYDFEVNPENRNKSKDVTAPYGFNEWIRNVNADAIYTSTLQRYNTDLSEAEKALKDLQDGRAAIEARYSQNEPLDDMVLQEKNLNLEIYEGSLKASEQKVSSVKKRIERLNQQYQEYTSSCK